LKLKGFEPFQASEPLPIDYEVELKKYVEERAGTPQVNMDPSEFNGESSEGEVQRGLARLLDFVAAKRQPKRQSFDNNNLDFRERVVKSYQNVADIESRLLFKGSTFDRQY
jgi:hypothetical protein